VSRPVGATNSTGSRARRRKPGESDKAYDKRIAKLERDRVRKQGKAAERSNERKAQRVKDAADREDRAASEAAAAAADHAEREEIARATKADAEDSERQRHKQAADMQSQRRRAAAKAQAQVRRAAAAQQAAETAEHNVPPFDCEVPSLKKEITLKCLKPNEEPGENPSHAGGEGQGGEESPPPLKGGGSPISPPCPAILAGQSTGNYRESFEKSTEKAKKGHHEKQDSAASSAAPRAGASHARQFPRPLEPVFPPLPRLVPDPAVPPPLQLAEMWLLTRWLNQSRVCWLRPLTVRFGEAERGRLQICLRIAERDAAVGESPLDLLVSRLSYAVQSHAARFPAVSIDELLSLAMMLSRPLRMIRLRPAVVVNRFAVVSRELRSGRFALIDREVAHG